MTVGLPLMKNVLTPLAKSVLIPLRLTAAASGTDAAIHGTGTTTLIISNEEIQDIIKIIKYLEKSGLLMRGIHETIKDEIKEQKSASLSILLGTLAVSILENALSVREIIKADEEVIRAGQNF